MKDSRALSSLYGMWRTGLAIGAIVFLLAILFSMAIGCAGAEINVCYTHPVYGDICVGYNGKVYIKADLDDDARKAALEWVKNRKTP